MIEQIGSQLVAQTWQVALLGLIAWGACRWWASDRPYLAHALWAVVLLKCLTPPVWSSPTSPFSWLPHLACTTQLPAPTPAPDLVARVGQAAPDGTSAAVIERLPSAGPDAGTAGASWSFADRGTGAWLVIFWLAGAGVSLSIRCLRLALFLNWVRRLPRGSFPHLEELNRQLRDRLRVRPPVRLWIVGGPAGPAVLGLFRPVILLPEELVRGQSVADLEPLLVHELIHIRRGDLWWSALQTASGSLFWFHPLVRLAVQRLTVESERCCDEATLAQLACGPGRYARCLLAILEYKHQLRFAPALPGVRPVEITFSRMERIMRIGNGCSARSTAPHWAWLALTSLSILALPGAALPARSFDPMQDPTPPQSAGVKDPLVQPAAGSSLAQPAGVVFPAPVAHRLLPGPEAKAPATDRLLQLSVEEFERSRVGAAAPAAPHICLQLRLVRLPNAGGLGEELEWNQLLPPDEVPAQGGRQTDSVTSDEIKPAAPVRLVETRVPVAAAISDPETAAGLRDRMIEELGANQMSAPTIVIRSGLKGEIAVGKQYAVKGETPADGADFPPPEPEKEPTPIFVFEGQQISLIPTVVGSMPEHTGAALQLEFSISESAVSFDGDSAPDSDTKPLPRATDAQVSRSNATGTVLFGCDETLILRTFQRGKNGSMDPVWVFIEGRLVPQDQTGQKE